MRSQLFLLAFLSIHCGAADTGGDELDAANGGASTGGSRGSVFSPNGGSGSGTGGAGAGESGGTGAGTGGEAKGGFSCSDASVLACDDFEGQTVGTDPGSPWKVVLDPYSATSSYVEVSSEKAHSGSLSVKVSAGGGYTNRALVGVPGIFPVDGNHFFVRFWAYYEKAFGTINDGQHMTYAFATGPFQTGTPGDEIRAGVHGNVLNLNFRGGPTFGDPQLKAYTDGDKHQTGIEPIVQDWVCTEIEFDGMTDTINMWRNDESIGELHTAPGEIPTTGEVPPRPWNLTYADFRFGWQSYGGATMDAFFDDVVVSKQRIGCTGP